MVTRQTVAGVQGAEHAITRAEAIGLHTTSAVKLLGESDLRGSLTAGRLADFTVWPEDPMTCDVQTLRGLEPRQTVLGGRTVHGQ
jgi:predicted amidohydrolase YtcJ